jgi:hypothetical protein
MVFRFGCCASREYRAVLPIIYADAEVAGIKRRKRRDPHQAAVKQAMPML